MVDPGRIRSLLDRLAEERSHLRALAARDPAALVADPDLLPAVKYRHGYLRVDDERVVEVLRTRLGELEAFGSQVTRSALEEGGGP
ncbi:MAG TPA: hypothetical protein VNO79_01000 [Actinomycetota bacterium]|nr:hypothetical protein [Actinomycetota bacterium]